MLRRWAPLAAAVSVVAIVVAVSLVFHGSSGSPHPLRLAAATGTDSAVSAAAPVQGKLAAGGSSFVLVGSLPTGPDEARAHTLPRGATSEEEVRRLAGALGVTTTPQRVQAGWQAGALRVEDAAGHPWSLSGCAPDVPVADGRTRSTASWGTRGRARAPAPRVR